MLLALSAISFAPRPPVAARLPSGAALPKLIVFDLDNTLWTPELYQVARRVKAAPVAGRDVKLFPAAAAALHEIDTCDRWEGTQIAVASRTNQGDWARTLLDAFEVPGDPSRRLADLVAYQEIYTGNKRAHFESLRRRSGLPFGSMLFFDDARGGRFGNCEPVARMGVLSAHCPSGLTDGVWAHAVRSYAALAADEAWMGMVVPASGGAPESPDEASASASAAAREESNGGPHDATVVRWLEGKSFGFVRRVSGGGDLFVHASALPPGAPTPQKGDAVSVLVGVDRGGRVACTSVTPTGGPGPSEGARRRTRSSVGPRRFICESEQGRRTSRRSTPLDGCQQTTSAGRTPSVLTPPPPRRRVDHAALLLDEYALRGTGRSWAQDARDAQRHDV